MPDLVSSANGADYLIIYNKTFESQALQLQNHRETYDNFRVKITEIKDIMIYLISVLKVRMLSEILTGIFFYNWQQPRVKYICLFGRGSLDPKKFGCNCLS
ncbi:MAG: hypothetical protein IPM38_19195 [Ignavibacteria bacterium]|nr:hypothetical protein [Ignavibacteria bacterium]